MPVFTEYSTASRDLRVLPSFAPPLPRLTPPFVPTNEDERYEVIISGAGPAGLMLMLLLARYGLSDDSVLCIDSKPSTLKSGQADGLQPRTLEVLKSLGLVDEILSEGCQMWEVAFWNPAEAKDYGDSADVPMIERTSIVPDVSVPARYPHEVTIHQGRIERILEDDLLRYSKRGVQRSTTLIDVKIDEYGDPEFPVVAEIESTDGKRRIIRSKHLVGADGAHSVVRRSMGIKLEGESSDHIWGVVDFVADTDFPDIRRRSAIHSEAGSVMVIPRERISTGEYLTRLYVQVPGDVDPEDDQIPVDGSAGVSPEDARKRREKVTLEGIFKQAQESFKPYYIRPKDENSVDWWAAYQIGQRVTSQFTLRDSRDIHRVFIVGDACHTHSPKAGQGMNVSMMDSYNLAWKLAHSINGLTPTSNTTGEPDNILDTYHTERHTIAQELIEFDKAFSSMFSGKIGAGNGVEESLSHDHFLEVFSTGNGFTSGCGIEYPNSDIVDKPALEMDSNPIEGTDFLSGVLRPGRRLLSTRVKRHADGVPRELQDDFPSTGRFRIFCLTSTDLLDENGESAHALTALGDDILPRYPKGMIEMVVIHPPLDKSFAWKDIPAAAKTHSEMKFYGAETGAVYSTYGVSPGRGAIAVVRPDGYIGVVARLSDTGRVEEYLKRCLRKE
ncbi:hypothetical protein FQN54_008806 [Arachnomyces sp. PD_36]|nr:hypothetical protein FQN54_008806 [Arachnomyces sp. PD_36]